MTRASRAGSVRAREARRAARAVRQAGAGRAGAAARRGTRGRGRRATASRSGSRTPKCPRKRSGERRRGLRRAPRRPRSRRLPRRSCGARCRTAYQTPIAATASPTCSFVAIARAARSANAHSRPSSRCHHANRSSGHASATGWKSLTVSHCTRRREEVREGERRRGPIRADVLAAEPEDRQCAARDGDRLDDEQQLGARPEPPERARAGRGSGRNAQPSREICSPWTSVTERKSPCAVDQTACVMLPRSKRPLSKARCLSTGGRSEASPRRRRRHPDEDGRRHRARSCSMRPSQRAPSTASLAWSR